MDNPENDPRPTRHGQEGIALVAAILVGVILVILGMLLVSISFSESTQSVRNLRVANAAQAAEAGLDDYVAKLTQDHYYATHWVHPAELPRVEPSTGGVTAPGQPWTGGTTWTYATTGSTWKQLPNGYEYQLRIEPPSPGSTTVTVITTGRRTNGQEARTYEASVRPATPLDFQYITQRDLSLAASAVTRGKVYVGRAIQRDQNENPILGPDGKPRYTNGTLSHPGTAYADVMSEGGISPQPTRIGSANWYSQAGSNRTGANIRSVVANPLDFDQLTVGSVKVNQTAQSGGLVLNDPAAAAWRLVFNANGTLSYTPCRRAGTGIPQPTTTNGKSNVDIIANNTALPYYAQTSVPRTCNHAPTRTVDLATLNGAVYVEQTALVSGRVNGRVTVAAFAGIVIEGPTTYVNPTDDVLGLISAETNLWIADFVVSSSNRTFTWYAGLLLPHGKWQVSSSLISGSTMNFYGSLTAQESGNMSGRFATRNYNYDPNLQFLQPPYFPVLEDAYQIQSFREITPAA